MLSNGLASTMVLGVPGLIKVQETADLSTTLPRSVA
jgi:hypothetical protein